MTTQETSIVPTDEPAGTTDTTQTTGNKLPEDMTDEELDAAIAAKQPSKIAAPGATEIGGNIGGLSQSLQQPDTIAQTTTPPQAPTPPTTPGAQESVLFAGLDEKKRLLALGHLKYARRTNLLSPAQSLGR